VLLQCDRACRSFGYAHDAASTIHRSRRRAVLRESLTGSAAAVPRSPRRATAPFSPRRPTSWLYLAVSAAAASTSTTSTHCARSCGTGTSPPCATRRPRRGRTTAPRPWAPTCSCLGATARPSRSRRCIIWTPRRGRGRSPRPPAICPSHARATPPPHRPMAGTSDVTSAHPCMRRAALVVRSHGATTPGRVRRKRHRRWQKGSAVSR
jgi:hypothetical protein